jgi:hypothetical protein
LRSKLFRQPVQVQNYTGAYDAEGQWVKTPDGAPFEIMASIQPDPQLDIQSIPEGKRDSELYMIITDTELKTARLNDSPPIISYDGDEYEIIKKETWQNNVINHYAYVAALRMASEQE